MSEGDSVEVTMVLSHALPGNATITFDLWTSDDSSMPDDYTPLPESITFGANETRASFTITATQDTVQEPDELVLVFFTLPTGVEEVEYLIYGDHPTTIVTIVGDDTPGMTITPRTLDVDEGGTTTYTVKLNGPPTENVTVAITSDDTGAATVSPASLTFTPTDWNTPQTVTVTAVDDSDMNDEIVTLSNDPSGAEYDIVDTVSVKLNVADNDNPGVNVSTTALTVEEGDTTGDSYTVKLNILPLANVTVTVAGHLGTDVTPFPTTLTFTSTDWETAQTVTVKAANDADTVNDVVTLTHSATSTEQDYRGITIASVEVTVTDNDTAGVMIEPTALSVVAGRSNEYTVRLATEPTGNVTVGVTLPVGTDLSLDKTTLTFTVVNWDTAQTVIVSATENAATAKVTLAHAVAGSDYGSVTAEPVVVSVVGVAGQQPTLQVGVSELTQTLTVPEGGANSYILVLGSRPTGDVTVGVTLPTGTDLTLNSEMLTFTVDNWDVVQTVTVTAAADDDAANDTVTLTHSATSTDSDYNLITIASVVVTVADNDTAGVMIEPTALSVVAGRSNEYTVRLATEPTGNVTVGVTLPAGTDLSLDKTTLTFTVVNWDTAQTVIVSATENAATAKVTLAHAVAGSDYGSVTAEPVVVSVVGVAGQQPTLQVGVSELTQTLTVPEGGANSYILVLGSRPTGDVTVGVTLPTGTDLTLNSEMLTFTVDNWDVVQTVTVTAAADDDAANDTVTLTHSATSTDSDYNLITIASVVVTVADNDPPGMTVMPSTLALDVGEGGTAMYTVKLDTAPTGNVTVDITSDDTDVTPSPTTLTFTPTDWNEPQMVTVTAVEDSDRVDEIVTLSNDPSGANYDHVDTVIVDLIVNVADNDTATSVNISTPALTVVEEDTDGGQLHGGALCPQPTAEVTVTVEGHSDTDVTPSPITLTFTPTDWETPKTVTVTAGEDTADDTVILTHSVASTDTGYQSITIDSVDVTVTDNDTPRRECIDNGR